MAFADFQLKTAVKAFDLSEERRTDLFRTSSPSSPASTYAAGSRCSPRWPWGSTPSRPGERISSRRSYPRSKLKSRVEINVLPGVMLTVDTRERLDRLLRLPDRPLAGILLRAVARRGGRGGQARGPDRGARASASPRWSRSSSSTKKRGRPVPAVYGCVTSGSIWRFLKLKGKELSIDNREYYLQEVEKILGFLVQITRD